MHQQQLTFIVHLPGKPEHRAALEAGVREVITAMAAEPDFVRAALHRSQDAPDTLVVYETWSCSRDAFMAEHLARPYRQHYESALPTLLAAPRTIEFLDDSAPPLALGMGGAAC